MQGELGTNTTMVNKTKATKLPADAEYPIPSITGKLAIAQKRLLAPWYNHYRLHQA